MYNTLLIKRRLASSQLNTIPVLSGGELAYSEKNDVLYYGSETGTRAIGGDGAFVNRTTSQSISGDKSFIGSTTLSSTTFSTDSLIDVGGNIITNLGTPLSANHAATKQYVDDLIVQNFVDLTSAQSISGVKTFVDDAVFQQNLTITGNLSVFGDSTIIHTTVSTTSALSITNSGSGPALTVTQTGSNDIATFYDDESTALIIKDGGNVGIGLVDPGQKLTVAGVISASDYALLPGVNTLRVTTWGSDTVKLSNKVDGDNIYIQSTDAGRSILRWHSRANYGSGNSGDFSQIQAQSDGVWIKNESWSGGNYHHKWHFDLAGAITFPTLKGNNRTGSGENLQFPKTGNQKIISTTQGTSAAPTVERLVIAGGDSYYNTDTSAYEGEGGDLYLWAGRGDNGGDIKVDAGEGVNNGGTVKIRGGHTTNYTGGFVRLEGGYSNNGNGGEIEITAGNSGSIVGGYVTIAAGSGPQGGGNVTLQTGQNGTHQLLLSATGEVFVPKSIVASVEGSALQGFVIDGGTF